MMIHAIVGRAQSGKDTVASILEWKLRELGAERVKIVRLAGPLKSICSQIWTQIDFNDEEQKKIHRQKLVRMGTAVREIDIHAWVRLACSYFGTCPTLYSPPDHLIIPDVRFWSELYYLFYSYGRRNGFSHGVGVYAVYASEDTRERRMGVEGWREYEKVRNSPSETQSARLAEGYELKASRFINNSGNTTLDDLFSFCNPWSVDTLPGDCREDLETLRGRVKLVGDERALVLDE